MCCIAIRCNTKKHQSTVKCEVYLGTVYRMEADLNSFRRNGVQQWLCSNWYVLSKRLSCKGNTYDNAYNYHIRVFTAQQLKASHLNNITTIPISLKKFLRTLQCTYVPLSLSYTCILYNPGPYTSTTYNPATYMYIYVQSTVMYVS